MLNINKSNYLLYYLSKPYSQKKPSYNIKKCSTNKYYKLEKNFIKLLVKSYSAYDQYI